MIHAADRNLTFATLADHAARGATGLIATGLGEGGAVALMLRNDLPFLEAVLAVQASGANAVPVNWHFKAEELGHILSDSGATHLVIHADLLGGVREAIPAHVVVVCVPTPPDVCAAYRIASEAAMAPRGLATWPEWVESLPRQHRTRRGGGGTMSYTSGTTGRPKGVRRAIVTDPESRRQLDRLRREWFGFRDGMRTALIGPLYHSVQLTYALGALRADSTIFLTPRFDAERVVRLIDQERLTHLHLVPIMMTRLLNLPDDVRRRYDTSSLEFVVHGAAPCPPDVKRAMIDWWGPVLHEYYGSTEAGMISRCSSEEWMRRPGTVGRAWAGRRVAIYDCDGELLPANAEGEIYVSVAPIPDFTYHKAESARRSIERDGLVTNGDIGYLDDEGYLFLRDRKSDVVISGGVNIYPAEIEAVVASHPGVHDSAVVGIPDAEYGEALAAFVEPRAGATVTAEDIRELVRGRLATFKVPRFVQMVDQLPRDESGKVYKRALRLRRLGEHARAARAQMR